MTETDVDKLHFKSKLHLASPLVREWWWNTHTHLFHSTHSTRETFTHTHTYFITHTHTHTQTHSFSHSLLLIFLFPSLIVWNLLVSLVSVPISRSIGTRQLKCSLILFLSTFLVYRRYNIGQFWALELSLHTFWSKMYLLLSLRRSRSRTRISKLNLCAK